jgi:hypothetical protein
VKLAPPHEAAGGLYTTILKVVISNEQMTPNLTAQSTASIEVATIFRKLWQIRGFVKLRGGRFGLRWRR